MDRRHVWHPHAALPAPGRSLMVESASGVRLRTPDGRELVDGMAASWSAVHGYRHPVLDAAVTEQLGRMSHVTFGGITHGPAVDLCRLLIEVTPEELQHVFLSESGPVAVEVAVTMCQQYWRDRGKPSKSRIMTWRGGHHGDTFGAAVLGDPGDGPRPPWHGPLPPPLFADRPPDTFEHDYVAQLVRLVETHADELAAIVVEPVVQGRGGVRFHDPRYLHVLRELCLACDVLLVFDEVYTGFGRTGELFAADHAAIQPDVMCLGGALTGGYLPMAATLCSGRVAHGLTLRHDATFMGNPLAAAVAHASVSLLLERGWRSEVKAIASWLRAGLTPARSLPGVREVRILGAIGVIELDHDVDVPAATSAAVLAGAWLRPMRNLVYTVPPFVSTRADVATITAGMRAAALAG
ncbi:adenosylmethionine--8-amino-7-oxononanoate transaminase [Pseudonocardia endophytica]|nr:adenosylmethionine--8-amino-7-oxononanoate transaminase [Pseudonocardia endophytica]